mmetsp:Transcript_118844/g.332808  ORF Transcript_118844/g.332808 Transcript_118844/m.332808 type:complete len:106 (+) Transcript_118844:80-397(+)
MSDTPSKAVVDARTVDFLLRNVAVKATIGSLAFVPACIIFRGRSMRCLCGGLGMGFGAGLAWTQGDLFIRRPGVVPIPRDTFTEIADARAAVAQRWRNLTSWFGR